MSQAVKVARDDLKKALVSLTKAFHGRTVVKERTVVTLFEGQLSIAVMGVERLLPCEGAWDVPVTVSTSFILRLGKVLSSMDPVPIEVVNGKIRFGSSAIDCVVEDTNLAIKALPLADSRDLKKVSMVIERVEKILAPYGVTAQDIGALIEKAVDRDNKN